MVWPFGSCLFVPFSDLDLQALMIPSKLWELFLAGHYIEQDSCSKTEFTEFWSLKGP